MTPQRILLLVEDEPDVRMILRWHLMALQFTVVEATDGASGLELARRRRPAIIVLDVTLPGMNGLEVYRALRQDAATRGIPVLFLTGLSPSGYLSKESLQALAWDQYGLNLNGRCAVMAKPYDADRLEEALRALLEEASEVSPRKRPGGQVSDAGR